MGARKYTDTQLARALAEARTMRQLLVALGLAPYGGNYENVRRRIGDLGLDGAHLRSFRRARGISACTDAEVTEAVSPGLSRRR